MPAGIGIEIQDDKVVGGVMSVCRRQVGFLIVSILTILSITGCARYSAQPLNRIKTVNPHKQDGSEKPEKSI